MFNWYFSSGDVDFFWNEQIASLSWLPQVFYKSMGFGFNGLLSLWLDYPFRIILKLFGTLGISWFFTEKILWFGMFLLAFYASFQLVKSVAGKHMYAWVGSVVYAANTYILLLFAGGQLGVAWAYAYTPLALLGSINLINNEINLRSKKGLRNILIQAIRMALLVCLDLRLAYLTILMTILYVFMKSIASRKNARNIGKALVALVVSYIAVIPMHVFWILPTVLASRGTASLGEQFTSPDMLSFLSVADLPHAISLLHPNWPENLFGRVYFLQPEYLLIPLIAFSALVYISRKFQSTDSHTSLQILFFSILAIIGSFLAKGVKEPFGALFHWMFIHFPGFIMFRDPTKFYLFVAVSYAVLIPFALSRLYENLIKKYPSARAGIRYGIPVIFISLWLILLRSIFMGDVRQNFNPQHIPDQYIHLKDEMLGDKTPSRVLWLPQKEKFAFYSDEHPILSSENVFGNASISAVIKIIPTRVFAETLRDSGIGYVVVPQDIEKRLFLSDYVYDPKTRQELVHALDKTSLKKEMAYQDVAVYRNTDFVFSQTVPEMAMRQQQLANIGALVSIVSLVAIVIVVRFIL